MTKDITEAYIEARKNIFTHVGYDTEKHWRVLPLAIETDLFWHVSGDNLWYGSSPDELGTYCSEIIQGGICRGPQYSAVPVDTNCDRNVLLMVLDNNKEVTNPSEDLF